MKYDVIFRYWFHDVMKYDVMKYGVMKYEVMKYDVMKPIPMGGDCLWVKFPSKRVFPTAAVCAAVRHFFFQTKHFSSGTLFRIQIFPIPENNFGIKYF